MWTVWSRNFKYRTPNISRSSTAKRSSSLRELLTGTDLFNSEPTHVVYKSTYGEGLLMPPWSLQIFRVPHIRFRVFRVLSAFVSTDFSLTIAVFIHFYGCRHHIPIILSTYANRRNQWHPDFDSRNHLANVNQELFNYKLLLCIFSGTTIGMVLSWLRLTKTPRYFCKTVFFKALNLVIIALLITKRPLYLPKIINSRCSYAPPQPLEINFTDLMPYFWCNVLFGTGGFLLCSVIFIICPLNRDYFSHDCYLRRGFAPLTPEGLVLEFVYNPPTWVTIACVKDYSTKISVHLPPFDVLGSAGNLKSGSFLLISPFFWSVLQLGQNCLSFFPFGDWVVWFYNLICICSYIPYHSYSSYLLWWYDTRL